MSSKKKIGIAAGSLLAVVLVALGIYKVFFAPKGHTQNLTDPALSAAVVADYTGGEAQRAETFASGSKGYSWENGDPFNVWWKAENAVYDGGKLTLRLSEMTEKEQVWNADGTSSDCLSEYYGAEVRSEHYYGYGDFQVRMKPAAVPGTASTFFTCTGPYDVWYNADGSVQRANDHDEIDIEFLGKDTTRVQFNYFASGKGGHEYMYDLGFDASRDFHNYGYRWSEESITWFVDDKPVYKVLRSEIPEGEDWPEDPGRIVMNYWCGTSNAALWMGTFQNDYSSGAEYEWVASSAEAQPDPSSTKPVEAGQGPDQKGGELDQLPDTQWVPLDLAAFDGWGKYTVANTGDKVTVSHDKKLQKYDCCGMDLALGSRNKVSYTVTNTGKEKAWAKVSIKNTSGDRSAITSATVNGKDAGYYEYGVLCELAPGESADVVMLLDLGQKPSQMVVSLNSEADSEGKALRSDMPASGSIVISELKAVKSGETALPGAGEGTDDAQPSGGPKAPEGPVTEWAALDLAAFDGWGKYTVTNTGDRVTVSHSKKLQKYDCCGTDLALGTRNKVSYTVTNTGKEKAWAKVSIKNTSGDRSAITSATINGKDAGYYEYGVLCELAPGESADVVMLLDLGQKPSQMVVSLNSEADSEGKALRSDMPASGSIVISQLKAVKSGESVLPGASSQTRQDTQSQPEQPKAPDAPADQWAALDLSAFDGWGKYTVSKADGAITVSHDKAVAMYDCCGVDIALGERNKVQFSLTNNGAARAFAKVNVKDRNDSTGVSSIYAAAIDGRPVDYVQYGVLCELEPGQSAQVEIYVDGIHPADQLVLSLNSEGDAEGKALRSDMPQSGSVILYDLRAVKTEQLPAAPEQTQKQEEPAVQKPAVPDTQWADVDLSAVDGWGKYTVSKENGAVTVSHEKAVAMYDCCGGEIALGSRNKVKLTLTNDGKEKAFAKVNINDKTVTTGVSSIQAATVNGGDAGYIEYGVLCELPAGGSAQVELLMAPGKAADQLVISLNSEGDAEGKALRSDMPKTGKVTVSGVQAVKTDETTLAGAGPEKKPAVEVPLTQWADVDLGAFDGWGMYTVEKTGDSVTMSHDKALRQYACAGMNYDAGERNKVRMTLKNNGSKTAEAKVSIKSDKVDTSAILGATIDGKAVSDATYGVMCRIPAGKSVELVVFLDLKKDIKQLVVSLNSEQARGGPSSGSITLSGLQAIQSDEKFTKASGSSGSGGSDGGGGGDGGYTPPPPAVPGIDGTLTLNPSSGTGWNSSSTATAAEGGGVTLSHSSAQGVYGNYSWPVSMNGNNKMELDIVNNRDDVKAYAKVSLTTEGDNSGVSVLQSATVEKTAAAPALFRRMSRALPSPMAALSRAGGAVAVEDVQYGVLCELEPGESAHVVLLVKPDKLSQANKLVISLNSEGTEDGSALAEGMPASGSVTLKNIVCGQAETPEPDPGFTDPTTDWDLTAFEGWGMYTVNATAGSVQISHTEQRDQWHCCGIANDFGDAESVMFTVTNNDPANQAKVRFKAVKTGETEVNAVKSATVAVDGGDPAAVANPAEVDVTLEAGKSAVVRLSLDPEKHANQMTVFLNSTDAEGRLPAGSITISDAKWDKENDTPVEPDPEPGHGGDGVMMGQSKLTFSTENAYTIAYAEDNSAVTVSYDSISDNTYHNILTNVAGTVEKGDTVQFTATNNSDTPIALMVKIESATAGDGIVEQNYTITKGTPGTCSITVPADTEKVPAKIFFFIDSGYSATTEEHSGELTFSGFTLTKAAAEEPGDGVMMGDHKLTFDKNDVYSVSYAQGNTAMTVSYTAVKYNTYQNVNTGIENLVAVGDTLTFKVTNNRDDAVKLTTKIEGASNAETIYDNTVMVAKGSQNITVKVENSSYTPTKLFFFIDSGWSEASDETQRSGELVFSDFSLTKADEGDSEQGGDGVMMGENKLVFNKNDEYTVSYAKNNTTMTVTYTGVKHQTYINVNTSIKDIVEIGDTLKFTVKNNGAAAIKLGVKMEGATQSDVVYDQTAEIAGNEEKEITILISGAATPESLYFFIDSGWDEDTATEHSGNLTFSGFTLTKAGAAEPAAINALFTADPAPQPNEPPVTEAANEEEKAPVAAPPAAPVAPAEETGETPDGSVVDEPVINEPVANEPALNEPVANEPALNEPVINKPVVNEPVEEKSADGGDGEEPGQNGDEEQNELTEE